MKLKTKTVEIEYRGGLYRCEETVYACTRCDFELQQQWMKEKTQTILEEAYAQRNS